MITRERLQQRDNSDKKKSKVKTKSKMKKAHYFKCKELGQYMRDCP